MFGCLHTFVQLITNLFLIIKLFISYRIIVLKCQKSLFSGQLYKQKCHNNSLLCILRRNKLIIIFSISQETTKDLAIINFKCNRKYVPYFAQTHARTHTRAGTRSHTHTLNIFFIVFSYFFLLRIYLNLIRLLYVIQETQDLKLFVNNL